LLIEPTSIAVSFLALTFNDPFPITYITIEQLAYLLIVMLVVIFAERPFSLVK
jgi:hypothetical protein